MNSILFQASVWFVVLGSTIAIAGIIALSLAFYQRKRRDLSLAAFGVFSLLYGVRLLIEIQLESYSAGPPPQALLFLLASITYAIPVPLSGFLLHLFGKGWRNSMQWALRATIAFFCVGIISDALQAEPFSLMRVNNVLVIAWALVVLSNALSNELKTNRELRVVLTGFIVFCLFAANANLVALNILPWEWNEESYGFLAFLIALGYVAARRFFNNESRLRAMERELEIARDIQLSILPRKLPDIPGLEITARYVPMEAVAGDFYDVLVQDPRRLSVLVADVSGHGVGAALIASMLKIAFASQRDRLSDPAQVLKGMNRALHGKLENNFVTAGCVSLDLERRILRYAAAGHPPLLFQRPGKPDILEVSDNGLIIGPFSDCEYPLTTMAVESGDRIIMYTDGITETRNSRGEFFGERGFKEFIRSQAAVRPGPFIDSLLERLATWSDKPPHATLDDDLTILVLDILD